MCFSPLILQEIDLVSLSSDQRKVVDLVLQKKNVFFTGSAGTGKSYLLHRLKSILERSNYNVAVTAATGICGRTEVILT